jgi:hypothetical protein
MSIVGIPPEGLMTVGQIIATNELTFRPNQNGVAIALERSQMLPKGWRSEVC